ncbi:MAG: hypothetical protein JXA49_02795 [Actinobacteria bacterium]|nr:hypothetical protein [Actinomycetota bacterium]
MAHELEVTDELRKKIAEENRNSLENMGLKPDMVESWEDGYRTADEPDAFEWWYFDCQFEDGSTCVITFSTKPNTKPKGPLAPSVLIMSRSSEGERGSAVWDAEPGQFQSSKDSCDVKIGPSWVRGDLDRYELHAEAGNFKADLSFERKAPSWRPGAAVTYLDPGKTKYFAWVVPVPYGTVEGMMNIGGNPTTVKGTVYHDHNWGNFMLAGMIDHWYWGRAHVGDFSLIFSQMVTAGVFGFGAVKLPVFFLARENEILTGDGLPMTLTTSDFVEGPGGRYYPEKLDLSWHAEEGTVRITIRNPKLIESLDMLKDVKWFLKPLVHVVTDPYYYDFDAEMELEVDIKGIKASERGRVIYEQMLFHKKQEME